MMQIDAPLVVIYADDDQDDHETLAEAIKLSSLEFELWSVYDGAELIHLLRDLAPDLSPAFIIVDLNMPKMDGLSAIKCIKTKLNRDSLPIYTLSTSRNPVDRERGKDLGVAGFYTKPIRTTDLKNILEEMAIKSLKFQER